MPFFSTRYSYLDDGSVHYQGAKFHPGLGRDHQLVAGVEFLAMLVPHIALRYEVRVRTYGALSTTIRKRFGWIHKEEGSAPAVLTVEEDDGDSQFVRVRKRNWARLIRKVWLDDPELCARCGSKLQILSAVSSPEQDDVIEKILRCRNQWNPPWLRQRRPRGPPKQLEIFQDNGDQVPIWNPDDENQDPPADAWLK